MNGVFSFAVTCRGYSLIWYEGNGEFQRADWRHGVVYSPPDQMFHQHFNLSSEPSRYLALQMGSVRYPMTQGKKDIWAPDGMFAKKIQDGGMQIEYEDQDPRIHGLWLDELKSTGVMPKMDAFIGG